MRPPPGQSLAPPRRSQALAVDGRPAGTRAQGCPRCPAPADWSDMTPPRRSSTLPDWDAVLGAVATEGWTAAVVGAERLDTVRARVAGVLASGDLPGPTAEHLADETAFALPPGLPEVRSVVVAPPPATSASPSAPSSSAAGSTTSPRSSPATCARCSAPTPGRHVARAQPLWEPCGWRRLAGRQTSRSHGEGSVDGTSHRPRLRRLGVRVGGAR
jgi:hypothetical protein